ncbi:2439_t:CDS:2, partial [Entrophospora sp. SA101]
LVQSFIQDQWVELMEMRIQQKYLPGHYMAFKTREQFNQWRTKWIELYKNDPMMRSSIINRQYEEYYIPYNWIDSKKSQLWTRFQKRLLEIEA